MGATMISVRIPSELKEKLERYGVSVSETVRVLLKRHMEELELRDLAERLEGLKKRMGGRVDPELVARLVREDREAK